MVSSDLCECSESSDPTKSFRGTTVSEKRHGESVALKPSLYILASFSARCLKCEAWCDNQRYEIL